jgi:hypothetical protein
VACASAPAGIDPAVWKGLHWSDSRPNRPQSIVSKYKRHEERRRQGNARAKRKWL